MSVTTDDVPTLTLLVDGVVTDRLRSRSRKFALLGYRGPDGSATLTVTGPWPRQRDHVFTPEKVRALIDSLDEPARVTLSHAGPTRGLGALRRAGYSVDLTKHATLLRDWLTKTTATVDH